MHEHALYSNRDLTNNHKTPEYNVHLARIQPDVMAPYEKQYMLKN